MTVMRPSAPPARAMILGDLVEPHVIIDRRHRGLLSLNEAREALGLPPVSPEEIPIAAAADAE